MLKKVMRDRFIDICRNAMDADVRTSHTNCRVLEPYFQDLISLAEPHGDNFELKTCFISIVTGDIDAPSETLAYCMRALRFEEVVDASKRKLGDPPDPRWMNFHRDILHAMNDKVWEDSDMWERLC